jgi:hypothetical protein
VAVGIEVAVGVDVGTGRIVTVGWLRNVKTTSAESAAINAKVMITENRRTADECTNYSFAGAETLAILHPTFFRCSYRSQHTVVAAIVT